MVRRIAQRAPVLLLAAGASASTCVVTPLAPFIDPTRTQLDQFGYATALWGSDLIVSAPGATMRQPLDGLVRTYVRSSDGWSFTGELSAPVLRRDAGFGKSVAMDGEHLIVGAPLDLAGWQGSAWIFGDADSGFPVDARLTSPAGTPGDEFGWSVAVRRSIAVVGAPRAEVSGFGSGAAYVYRQSSGNWLLGGRLLFPESELGDARRAEFGFAVATDGTTIAVGAPGQGWFTDRPGAVSVFTDAQPFVDAAATLPSPTGQLGDRFGHAIAVDGSWMLVGAPGESVEGSRSGAVYAYRFERGTWQLKQALVPTSRDAGDRFGASIDLSGGSAIVGAPNDSDLGWRGGSAFRFQLGSDGFWRQVAHLGAPDEFGTRGVGFASDVAAHGPTTVATVPGWTFGGYEVGGAVSHITECQTCLVDLTSIGASTPSPGYGIPDGEVTGDDLDYFVAKWLAHDPSTDLTTNNSAPGGPGDGIPDGIVTPTDLSFFVELWMVGCP